MSFDISNYEHAMEKLNEISNNLDSLEDSLEKELGYQLSELRNVYNMTPAKEIHMRRYFKDVLTGLEAVLRDVREKGYY